MTITAATGEQFDTFLTGRGRTVAEDHAVLLVRSLDFLSTIELCQEGETHLAQCHIAWAMSEEGDGFNPAAVFDEKTLTKKGLGRNAIVKEFVVNSELSGTDSISLLKRIPMAYGLLKPLLCQSADSSIVNFELSR